MCENLSDFWYLDIHVMFFFIRNKPFRSSTIYILRSLAFQLCSSLAQDAPAAEAPAEAPDEEKPVLGLDGCGAHVTSRCVNFPSPLLQAS